MGFCCRDPSERQNVKKEFYEVLRGLWFFRTNNRFHFGVGVSPWYEDFLATGERGEKRGKRRDEQIEILKGLMNGEYFSYKGES